MKTPIIAFFKIPSYFWIDMRIVLLIPVLVLFLSNVPFIHEMPMEQMMAMMQEREEKCCKKEALQGSCIAGNMPDVPSKDKPADGCCQRTETTCHCICFFQFTAPANEVTPLQFGLSNTSALQTGFIPSHWKDPHIASPGQPPDLT